jgi:hypothetical protein
VVADGRADDPLAFDGTKAQLRLAGIVTKRVGSAVRFGFCQSLWPRADRRPRPRSCPRW